MKRIPAHLYTIALLALVLISVWAPPFTNHYVSSTNISTQNIEDSRKSPKNVILSEMESYMLGLPKYNFSKKETITHADNIINGVVSIPNSPVTNIAFPFRGIDLSKGHSSWQLSFASLNIVDILVNAYLYSDNITYLKKASIYLNSWYKYEKNTYLPNGFLWNDHAIASRMGVYIKFWNQYRNSAIFDSQTATNILKLVNLTAEHLANKEQFTFSTNHGVMQNLSLMRFSLAFPELDKSHKLWNIGLTRLTDQLGFFINNEGVVLEHSAEYHIFGYQLLGEALRYMTLKRVTIPTSFIKKYELAGQFINLICQPERKTLPRLGDTTSRKHCENIYTGEIKNGEIKPLTIIKSTSPPRIPALYPAAGYAISWLYSPTHSNTQTVFNSSYHKGHGHKHADDLSINVMSDNIRWLTASGYYPYIYSGRSKAVSWQGSNAPHFLNEETLVERTSSIQGSYSNENIMFIDAIRQNSDNSYIRRQLFQLDKNWIVLDSFSSSMKKDIETIWYVDSGLNIDSKNEKPLSYIVTNSNNPAYMNVSFSSSSTSTPVFSSGEVELARKPVIVNTLRWKLPKTTKWSLFSASVINHSNTLNNLTSVEMKKWDNDKEWTVKLTENNSFTLERRNELLILNGNELLIKNHEITDSLRSSQSSYALSKKLYKTNKQKDHMFYRMKVTKLLLAIFFTYVILRLILGLTKKTKSITFLNYSTNILSISLMTFLHYHYFVS